MRMATQGHLLIILALTCVRLNAKVVYVDGSAGSRCLMSDGVAGKCREVNDCLTHNGTIRRNQIIHRCNIPGTIQAEIYVCCRQPAQIAKTLCSAWSSFWGCLDENPLIIGGVEAARGEFKHIAAVGKIVEKGEENSTIFWQCGGSLITPHFVLTAAHCVTNKGTKYVVRLGEHDTRFNNKSPTERLIGEVPETLFKAREIKQSKASPSVSSEQTIEVELVTLHPQYRKIPKYHDIALLQLKQPAIITRFVLPACLPSENHIPPRNGDILHAAGWGRTVANLRASSPTLQKVDLPVVDNRKCSLHFRKDHDKKNLPLGITKDMVCAGKLGKDTCKGDSGGPLVRQLKSNNISCSHELIGLVSFGRGCGDLGVYTRVSLYLDWIIDYIAPNMT